MEILFCIVGRSASGKDTLTNVVCEHLKLEKVVSCTTRPPRYGEKEGVNYYYKKQEDYNDNIPTITKTQIGEVYYWATEKELEGKNVFVIDPKGLKTLKNNIDTNKIKIVTIFVNAPKALRDRRAYLRAPLSFDDYLIKCEKEDEQFSSFEQNEEYDYYIHNVHFECCVEQIKAIIKYEREHNVF